MFFIIYLIIYLLVKKKYIMWQLIKKFLSHIAKCTLPTKRKGKYLHLK